MDDSNAIVERGAADPVWWFETVLGCSVWEAQAAIAQSICLNKRTAVASCHGAGKSFTAARVVLHFLYHNRPSTIITTAPTQRQVEGILWKEIGIAHSRALFKLGGHPLTKKLELERDWLAWGFTTRDYDADRFQGFHEENILVVVDEASGVMPAIFTGIEGVLSSENARLLLIGNPTDPTSNFAAAFKDPAYKKFYISAFDTPNFTEFGITLEDMLAGRWREKITGDLPFPKLVTPEWVEDKIKRWGVGSALWDSRVMGIFPKESRDTLIPLAWVERAMQNSYKPDEEDPIDLGVDVAREGDDASVCYARQARRFRKQWMTRKTKTTETTGRTVDTINQLGPDRVFVDEVGVGAGVFDNLKEDNHPAIGINFGSKPCPEENDDDDFVKQGAERARKKYANLKAQLYWNIRRLLEADEMDWDPTDEDIVAEATGIRYKLNRRGQIQIEEKSEMKKRGQPSPDSFEALVYSAAADIVDLDK